MSPVMGPLRRRTTAMIAALVGCVLVLSGCSVYSLPLPGGQSVGSNPLVLHLMFHDVLDLVPQSTVKLNDVTVGKVTAIGLKGYIADVTIEVPNSLHLPTNEGADIQQTSLLGEKFIALVKPSQPATTDLKTGDTIPLAHTGRNPEVEEVFSALALLLNGGGVAQLKTIAHELNSAVGGRESQVRSVLTQIRVFMGQLSANKQTVVSALDNLNRLAVQLRGQDGTIKSTLADLPGALKSLNGQRADLVRVLRALSRLSSVGVHVIQASKVSTINSLQSLAPVLSSFAKAGQALPKSLQVFLTYPFVDAAVGNNATVARNLRMGDYTNLSVRFDATLGSINLPTTSVPSVPVPTQITAACGKVKKQVRATVQKMINEVLSSPATQLLTAKQRKALRQKLEQLVAPALSSIDCKNPQATVNKVANLINRDLAKLIKQVLGALKPVTKQLKKLCKMAPGLLPPPLRKKCSSLLGGGGGGGGGGGLPLPTISVGPITLGRADLNSAFRLPTTQDPYGLRAQGFDPGLGTLLFQGVAP